MSSPAELLAQNGLDSFLQLDAPRSGADGMLREASGSRCGGVTPEMLRAFRFVLERERPGSWPQMEFSSGQAGGAALARQIDAQLAAQGRAVLSAVPLEACLAFLERLFAERGWGLLHLDLTHAAEHGVVVARLENAFAADALRGATTRVDFHAAGFLQAFFEHISGQKLGCEEIACRAQGASHCTFVLTAAERLVPIAPFIGREPAETILRRLTG